MSEPNTKPRFETAEALAAYTQNRLLVILSRLAFDHVDQAKFLAAQLMTEMAVITQQAGMAEALGDPNRYDLSALPAQAAFDE